MKAHIRLTGSTLPPGDIVQSYGPVVNDRASSSYARRDKRPYNYSMVPLNKGGEGLPPTPENEAKFRERVGLQPRRR